MSSLLRLHCSIHFFPYSKCEHWIYDAQALAWKSFNVNVHLLCWAKFARRNFCEWEMFYAHNNIRISFIFSNAKFQADKKKASKKYLHFFRNISQRYDDGCFWSQHRFQHSCLVTCTHNYGCYFLRLSSLCAANTGSMKVSNLF